MIPPERCTVTSFAARAHDVSSASMRKVWLLMGPFREQRISVTGFVNEGRAVDHPGLHAGPTPGKKRGLPASLDAHGYRVAPVTLDNGDSMTKGMVPSGAPEPPARIVEAVE
jgi:hypothetical protein